MINHIKLNEVGNVDALPNIIFGKRYHIMSLKEPYNEMLMIGTYGTLETLEGSDTQQRYKGSGG